VDPPGPGPRAPREVPRDQELVSHTAPAKDPGGRNEIQDTFAWGEKPRVQDARGIVGNAVHDEACGVDAVLYEQNL
jgi:hypothetical protein